MKLKWIKGDHPIWGKGGREESIHSLGITTTFPKFQWKTEGFSIVGPANIFASGNDGYRYELYDGQEVYKFKTLKDAKTYAESLITPKQDVEL